MEVLGGLAITSPRDLECKKVKTTQAGRRAQETKLGLKLIVKLWKKQT